MSSIPANKAELVEAITRRSDKLRETLAELPAHLTNEATMPGHAKGTKMSPADLLAYLIGWHEQVLTWLASDDAGRAPDFPAKGYRWNQLGALAREFYGKYRSLPFAERTQRLIELQGTVLEEVTARSEDELYATGWYGKWTKGRMIQLNTTSPYDNARSRLRSWLQARS